VDSRRAGIAAVGAIIGLPVVFAALGGGQAAGLAIGVVLVVGGLVAMLRGAR
jgi:hypothetical protein